MPGYLGRGNRFLRIDFCVLKSLKIPSQGAKSFVRKVFSNTKKYTNALSNMLEEAFYIHYEAAIDLSGRVLITD
jgi:hypothetical protein